MAIPTGRLCNATPIATPIASPIATLIPMFISPPRFRRVALRTPSATDILLCATPWHVTLTCYTTRTDGRTDASTGAQVVETAGPSLIVAASDHTFPTIVEAADHYHSGRSEHHPKRGSGSVLLLTGACHCGAAGWTFEGDPGPVTACNCTLCRRYGALWAYDYEGERVAIGGETTAYRRLGKEKPALEILFCSTCSCVLAWRALQAGDDGRRRMAVNVRLAPLAAVADLPIDHFDGLKTFEDLPADDRVVRDLWA